MASSISTQWRQAQRKERLSLSLSFTNRSMSPNDGNATSSSDISAGPLTPDDDDHDSRLDSYSFFTQPSKAPRPPHLFSLYEADNEDLSPVEAEMPSPVEQTILPSSISSFDILGTLGRGTYGKVLLGINPGQLGALRAIKTIKKSGIHPYGLEEIEREIRTLHKISAAAKSEPGRSFVQNMFSSFTNEEYAFLVLEYHPTTLVDPAIASLLRLDGPVGLTTSASLPHVFPALFNNAQATQALHSLRLLAAELVLALLFLHGTGIIHQDVKPANIMVSATGHVVLGDFGASSWSEGGGKVIFEPTDVVTFTPLYAAPELVHRDQAGDAGRVVIDGGVDWWSLGVVLYELATGTLPFDSTEGRRTVGDFSCSFGEMERLAGKSGGHGGQSWWDVRLEAFIRMLLVHDPYDRINDENVKHNIIFEDFDEEMWSGIAHLAHPPLPPPCLRHLDSDVGLSLTNESCDIGQLPMDLPLHDSMIETRSIIRPLPSSASIYRFCCTEDTNDGDSTGSDLDISNVLLTPVSDVLSPRDDDVGHADVAEPVLYRRTLPPGPSPLSRSSLPFPSSDGHVDVSAPYVYKRAMKTSVSAPSPLHNVLSPHRPVRDSYLSGRSLRRISGRRQLKRAREWEGDESGGTLEESLTMSMLNAMERKKVERPSSQDSGGSIVGAVVKRLRRFSMRNSF